MNDEGALVICILLGMAGIIVGLVRYQRWVEARLVGGERIEIAINSTGRSVVVALLALVLVPSLVGVVGTVTDPWMRGHALGAVLVGLFGSGASLLVAMAATRRFRRLGQLVWTKTRLDLEVAGARRALDLTRTFALYEWGAAGAGATGLQAVVVSQDGTYWGFSYRLPVYRRPHGPIDFDPPRAFDTQPHPVLDGEARVVHDLLREAPMRNPEEEGRDD